MGWKGGKKHVINDGDNDNVNNDDIVWGKGGKKHVIDDGDNEDDDDDSVEGGSSLSLSDEVVTWVFFQSVICQLQIIQSVILQIVPNYFISFLMIIHRIGDATEDNSRWLHLSIYKSYIRICILSPYSLAIKHSAEVIVDGVVKWVFMYFALCQIWFIWFVCI